MHVIKKLVLFTRNGNLLLLRKHKHGKEIGTKYTYCKKN